MRAITVICERDTMTRNTSTTVLRRILTCFSNDTFYEFTEVKLTENEFNNLVFMGPPQSGKNIKTKTTNFHFFTIYALNHSNM